MKNVLITGAETGLGNQLGKRMASDGHRVYNLARYALREGKYAVEEAIRQIPMPLHWVVNNYGINHLSWIGQTPGEDEQILRVNVMGPYWVVNALVARGETCKVVNIASQVHRVPQRCTALYGASKAALVQMTRVMARELAPTGWQVNALAPGKIEGTQMTQRTDQQVVDLRDWQPEDADAYARSLIPMERFTSTEEVTDAILMMLEMPAYINGTVIDMTGGA